ncbi:MAG: hypothetical protein V4505_00620 [Pseudomonadota bacterium]
MHNTPLPLRHNPVRFSPARARLASALLATAVVLAGCASQPIPGFPSAQPQSQPAANLCQPSRQAGTFELTALLAPNGPPVAAKFSFHPAAPGAPLKPDMDLGMQYLDNMQPGQTFQGYRETGAPGVCPAVTYKLEINGKTYVLEASQ